MVGLSKKAALQAKDRAVKAGLTLDQWEQLLADAAKDAPIIVAQVEALIASGLSVTAVIAVVLQDIPLLVQLLDDIRTEAEDEE